MKSFIALSVIAAAMSAPFTTAQGFSAMPVISETPRPIVTSETIVPDVLLIQQRRAVEPQFDPPRCVSGADTYCQPIGNSPPPAKLPAHIPQ